MLCQLKDYNHFILCAGLLVAQSNIVKSKDVSLKGSCFRFLFPSPFLLSVPTQKRKNKMPSVWGSQEIVLIFCFTTRTYIFLAAVAWFLPVYSSLIATWMKLFQNSLQCVLHIKCINFHCQDGDLMKTDMFVADYLFLMLIF